MLGSKLIDKMDGADYYLNAAVVAVAESLYSQSLCLLLFYLTCTSDGIVPWWTEWNMPHLSITYT